MAESIGATQPLLRVAAWQPPFQRCGELEDQTNVPRKSRSLSGWILKLSVLFGLVVRDGRRELTQS